MIELTYLLLIFVVAAGAGRRLLRMLKCPFDHVAEDVCFSLGIGLGLLALSVFALAVTHLLYTWSLYALLIMWGVIGAGSLPGWGQWIWQRSRGGFSQAGWISTCLALFWFGSMGLGLIRAIAPIHGAVDPLAYHLALPKIYLAKHFLSFERTITGSLYPANVEMLFTMGIGLRSGVMAQLIHYAFGVASSLSIFVFAARRFNVQVGLWSALIFHSMPVVIYFSSVAYIDVGVCFFQILGTWALFNWLRRSLRTDLLLAGICMGLAMGSKHSAIFLGVAGGLLIFFATLYRERQWASAVGQVTIFAGIMLIVVSPWYIRSYLESGNPVWPQLNAYFGGLTTTQADALAGQNVEIEKAEFQPPEEPPDWRQVPIYAPMFFWRWAFEVWGGAQRFAGCCFVALLPGVLVYVRRERALWDLVAFGYLFTTVTVLWMHANPRYTLSGFAFLSVLCGYVAYRLSSSNVLYRIVLNSTLLAMVSWSVFWNYQMAKPIWDVACGNLTEDNFLRNTEPTYAIFDHVNKTLPASSTVLLQGLVKGYYCDRPYVWDHPNQAVLVYGMFTTAERLLKRMRELNISYIVRIRSMPSIRQGFYPDYFRDPLHMDFMQNYLSLLYMDDHFLLFEVSKDTSPKAASIK